MTYAHISDYLSDIRSGPSLKEPPGGTVGQSFRDARLIAYARGLKTARPDYVGWLQDKIDRERDTIVRGRLRLWRAQVVEGVECRKQI